MKKNLFLKSAAVVMLVGGLVSCSETVVPGDLLDASAFETEIDGKPVSLYTISNGEITAQITNYAGYIVGLYVPDKDGNYDNVVSHNNTIEEYLAPSRNPLGAALGRYANRIANATFTLDGTEYNLVKNNGENTLHGGLKEFNHLVWDVDEVNASSLVLSCTLEDGLEEFPGNLKTVLTFSLTKDNALSINYEAVTDKPTVCNLSHHVYFNLDGAGTGEVLEHELMVNADSITEVDGALIPTGNILPVEGTVFDFRKPVLIGDRQVATQPVVPGQPMPEIPEGMVRSYDQNFCLNHTAEGIVELVATLYSPKTGRFMEVLNNQPGLQVFTGNKVAIALESQKYPDSPNHPEFPSTVLRPGEKYNHTIEYRFSIK